MTHSLADVRRDLLAIAWAGIHAAGAGHLVERALASSDLQDCHERASCKLIAVGKAAVPSARAALTILGPRIGRGILIRPREPESHLAPLSTIAGGHPVPDEGSERAGREALALATSMSPDEVLVVLITGGASSLMAMPADAISLDDKRATTAHLLRAGADIYELNAVRKHLSAVKGGWLAARAAGRCLTFAVSDVVGDDASVIGSGPTVADASTFDDALDVLRRFGGETSYPLAVVARLTGGARGRFPETPKPGDSRLSRAATVVAGSRRDAMRGAAEDAEARGYRVLCLEEPIVGEARIAGPSLVQNAIGRASLLGRPVCIVSSGETTVHVQGSGKGGRNQELALACVGPLAAPGATSVAALASVGTDGIDGPTDAAGALVDTTTAARARAAGLRPEIFLDNNDAYSFFDRLGDLVRTGPTDTNVGDLQVLLMV